MPSEVAVGEQLRRPLAAAAAAAAGKGQQGAAAAAGAGAGAEQEQLACPRCDSTNTKFCYYNNYNFSQPRHFCKACRRYWTHGGTLRDIPVGGGSRKNAKRSRTAPLSSAPLSASPVLLPPLSGGGGGGGSFTSLLNTQGPGFLALGGFGLGLGSGLEELGFGLGRGVWALGEGVGGNGGGARGMGATWQFEGGDHHDHHQQNHHHHHHLLLHHNHHGVAATGGAVGDFCSWAEPVVSTPGSGLK